jgi:hypothetical protein
MRNYGWRVTQAGKEGLADLEDQVYSMLGCHSDGLKLTVRLILHILINLWLEMIWPRFHYPRPNLEEKVENLQQKY